MVLEATGLEAERPVAVFAVLADPARLLILAVLADCHLAAGAAALVAGALGTTGFDAAVRQPAGCADTCQVAAR